MSDMDSILKNDKMVVERIDSVIKEKKIQKKNLAETIHWPLSRLSKILSGKQAASFSDLLQITAAIGYPLEAFIQDEFDLAGYERENGPVELKACFEIYFDGCGMYDVVQEVMTEEFPYAIRHCLGLDNKQYAFHYELNELTNPFYSVNDTTEAYTSYKPQIAMRPQGILSQYDDFIELGYWLSDNKRYAILAITFSPNMDKMSAGFGEKQRHFYKALVETMDTESFDKVFRGDDYFPKALRSGEICSVVYDFFENTYTNAELENDLRNMFAIYEKLIIDSAKVMEQFYWSAQINRRSLAETKRVLAEAEYKCFLDPNHQTFIDASGNPYMEAHHIIPLSHQKDYDNSIDVAENIICLCPMCHARIHHAPLDEKERMLVDIFYEKKDGLKKCGIDITLSQLLGMYSN